MLRIEILSPPALYKGCIVLMVFLHFLLPIHQIIVAPYRYLGIVLFIGGAWFAVWAKRIFQQTKTPIKPSERPVRIHVGGPFRVSRNPMYLGIFVGLLGIAVLLGSVSPFIFPVLFFIAMDRMFIPFEERTLGAALPADYKLYKAKVRRWI